MTRLSALELRVAPGRRRREAFVRAAFAAAAGLTVVVSAAIVLSLLGNALSFIAKVDLGALWSDGWFPRRGMYDIKTIVAGTLIIAGIAMLVAAPLGIATALYLSEYAGRRTRSILKPVLELLAAIPSVVLGFFALTWISPNLIQRVSDAPLFSMASAGIAVGILVTPLVSSVAEDAMHAVPDYLREASLRPRCPQAYHQRSGRGPRRGQRYRGGAAARGVAGDRGDHDRRHRRRRHRWLPVRPQPAGAGPDDDRGDDRPGHRL